MGDEHTWRKVLNIVRQYDRPFIIVSATARTTRQLLSAADQALENLSKAQTIAEQIQQRHHLLIQNFINNFPKAEQQTVKECKRWIDEKTEQLKSYLADIHRTGDLIDLKKDAVAAIGEQLSSFLFARCSNVAGLPAIWVDASKVIYTDSDFGQAAPNTDVINQKVTQLVEKLEPQQIPVMGGYYGQDNNGNITTLGFEGSDYTASLIGAAISARAIEIWTDVSGIYTCDPRLIKNARPIPQLSFQEATELAYFGAKVLHPSTTKPASQKQIPVWVKNIFEPEQPGTRISHESVATGLVKAITFKEHCKVITVTSSNTVMGYEFLSGVFDILRWHHLPVDVVTTTEASVSIAIEDNSHIKDAMNQLEKYGTVELESEQGIISLVGCTTTQSEMLICDVLAAVNSSSVNMISYSQSKGNLNLVMSKELIRPSVKAIHQRLFD